MLLGSPLGAKAREKSPGHPEGWIAQKIWSARTYRSVAHFDAEAYWRAVHASGLGLTSPEMRVLDCLLARARWSGQVRLSLARIGIGAAMSDVDQTVNKLIDSGWLTVIQEADPALPQPHTYRLTQPNSAADDQEPHGPLPPHPTPANGSSSPCGSWSTCPATTPSTGRRERSTPPTPCSAC